MCCKKIWNNPVFCYGVQKYLTGFLANSLIVGLGVFIYVLTYNLMLVMAQSSHLTGSHFNHPLSHRQDYILRRCINVKDYHFLIKVVIQYMYFFTEGLTPPPHSRSPEYASLSMQRTRRETPKEPVGDLGSTWSSRLSSSSLRRVSLRLATMSTSETLDRMELCESLLTWVNNEMTVFVFLRQTARRRR